MATQSTQRLVVFALVMALLVSCNGQNASSVTPQATEPPESHGLIPAAATNYPSTITVDAPTAYYRLDDTGTSAHDFSGHALNGTIGSSVIKSATGLIVNNTDTAMSFTGLGTAAGIVNVTPRTLLQPASAVTLEAWIRLAKAPKNSTVVIEYGKSPSAPYGFRFHDGKVAAQFALTGGNVLVTASTKLTPNTTYHIVSTLAGTTARLYVNGVQVATAHAAGTLTNYQTGYGFSIGGDAQHADSGFKGTIDEVAVYAGKALTTAQIHNHYLAGSGGVVPTPAPTPTTTPGTGYSDWTTFGDNLQRTGYNPNEGTLTPANVANGLKVAWATDLGGAVAAQPILATNVSINGTPANVLYVGAENNVFYAINADTGAIIWQNATFGAPQHGGCADLPGGTFGITGTATYDKAAGLVYVTDGSDVLHALSMTTGVQEWSTNVLFDPNTNAIVGAPTQDQIYGALTLNKSNGRLYTYTGSLCEVAPWHGRIVAISTSTHNVVAAFFPGRTGSGKTGTAYCGGGIWGMGGASIDPSTNDVFVTTGNTESATVGGCTTIPNGETYPYGDAVVELDANLNPLSSQTATINGTKVSGDSDYGATAMLYSVAGCASPQVSAKNKDGYLYTYGEAATLTFEQQLQMAPKTSAGQFIGVPAYDPTKGLVFVGNPAQTGNFAHGLNAFTTSGCSGLSLAWKADVGAANATAQDNQAPTVANGIVFFTDGIDNQVWAFNETNGTVLWHSGTLIGAPCASYGTTCGVFGAPTVDRRVYVGSFNHKLYAFSL